MKRIILTAIVLFTFVIPSYALGASWTVMIYMAADNDLEPYAISDFLELSSVGSSQNVSIVVQLDRGGYDTRYGGWKGTNRFYVTQGMTPSESNAISDWGDGRGGREVNMGDPQELKSFVEWAKSRYPADHYLLVIWNHGQGWKGKSANEDKEAPLKWVCYDETNGDVLWTYELKEALNGNSFDIIAMDACLMGAIEVMAELQGIAQYFVASEETVPANGFPYNTIMSYLSSNPSTTARELCQKIVEKYGEAYYGWPLSITLSAIDMSKITDVINALNELADEVTAKKGWSSIKEVRDLVLSFSGGYQIDLGHLASLLSDRGFSKASGLTSAIESAVLSEFHSKALSYVSGISIYFPSGREYNPFYSDSRRRFLALSSWNDFLKNYFKATAPTISVPWSDVKPNIDGRLENDEWSDAYVMEKDGVKLYLKCDEKYLYIGIDDIKDSRFDEGDRVGIYFDTNGDWSWPSSKGNEGNYWIRYDGNNWNALFRAIWGNSGMPVSDENPTSVSTDELSFSASSSTGHLQYEIRIDYTARWNTHIESDLHLYIFAYNAGSQKDDIAWPDGLLGNDYGYLSPVNYGVVTLGEGGGTPAIEITPTEIDFGEVKINETEEESIIIRNVGTGVLRAEASLIGGSTSSFSITPTSLELPPGESTTMKVYFTPQREGDLDSFVMLETNDPLHPICYIYLKGSGKKEKEEIFGGCQTSPDAIGYQYVPLLIPPILISLRRRK